MVYIIVIVAALVTVAIWVTTMPKREVRGHESRDIPVLYPIRPSARADLSAPAWPPARFETPRAAAPPAPPAAPAPPAPPAPRTRLTPVTRVHEVELAIVPTE